MSDEEERKRLLELARETEESTAKLQNQARGITEKAQSVSDNVQILSRIIDSSIPLSKEQVRRLEGGLRQQNDLTRTVSHQLRESADLYFISVSGTNVLSTSTVAGTISASAIFPPEHPALVSAARHYAELAARTEAADDVRAELVRCGFDRPHSDRLSARELLANAEGAVGRGEDAASCLIPLRQAIEATVDGVLKRSPGQEKVSGWVNKLLSIGRRIGRLELPPDHFQRLGELGHEINDRLSASKDLRMERLVILADYYDGLAFLKALLASIDDKKLRL